MCHYAQVLFLFLLLNIGSGEQSQVFMLKDEHFTSRSLLHFLLLCSEVGSYCIAFAVLDLGNPSTSAFSMLGLHATKPTFQFNFRFCLIIKGVS